MRLTPHFTFEELTKTHSKFDNSVQECPSPDIVLSNIVKMAVVLERFRWFINHRSFVTKDGNVYEYNSKLSFDCAVIVNSCFRSRKVNADVGGKPDSRHLFALAFDIKTLVTDSCELYALWSDFVDSFVSEIFDVLNLEFHYAYKIDNDSIHVDFRLKSL